MLGGITVVLYGMIGLVGAKIWVENGVDFGDPVNLVGLAAGIIAGIGGVTLQITDDFELSGIALGTIMVIVASTWTSWRRRRLRTAAVDQAVGRTGEYGG